MEFVSHRDVLLLALSRAKSVVEKKTTMPILSNVLIKSEASDVIIVKATDLEQSIQGKYNVDVAAKGGFCLPAAKFFNVVKSLPQGNVKVVYDEEKSSIEVFGEKETYFELNTVPEEDFPMLPGADEVEFMTINREVMRSSLSFVLPSAAVDDPRIYLNSVYMEGRGKGKLRMVATDGHKLSVIDDAIDAEAELPNAVIIPRKSAQEMLRLLEEPGSAEIKLGFTEKHAFLSLEDVTFSTRLIDSNYPNYEVVIPASYNHELAIRRSELIEAMNRVAVLHEERGQRVGFDISQNKVIISSSYSEYGKSKQPVAAELTGMPINMGFPFNTFMDVLNSFKQENITIKIVGDETPARIEADGVSNYFGIVMPVKADE